jgi:ribosomal-protein-alanine N-acetyltransferase
MSEIGPVLVTPRLQFDLWNEDDFASLYDLHADPRVQVGYKVDPEKWTEGGIRGRLFHYIHEQSRVGITKWKMSLRDGTFIGRGGWSPWQRDEIEIGYALKPEHQGKGYALEAAKALVDWALRARSERLVGFALLDNAISRHILECSGMLYDGEYPVDGVPMAFYAAER